MILGVAPGRVFGAASSVSASSLTVTVPAKVELAGPGDSAAQAEIGIGYKVGLNRAVSTGAANLHLFLLVAPESGGVTVAETDDTRGVTMPQGLGASPRLSCKLRAAMRIGKLRKLRRVRLRAALRYRYDRARLIWKLPRRATGVEIGVWRGGNASTLLRWTRPRRLYLVDPWAHIERSGAMYAKKSQDEMDDICTFVRERFAGDSRVEIMRATSAAFDRPVDWAYIDGDHTYEGVLADLRTLWPLTRVCLAGDDYGAKGWWDDGVTRAVDQFCDENPCDKTIMGAQFLISKRRA